jgi:hypothetical protein
MKKKIAISMLVILFTLAIVPQSFAKAGKHTGEQNMLDVDIQFTNSYGETIANADGIFYNFFGWTIYENKVYPSKYWGEFPLYFFGTKTGVTVKVTNNGPRAKAKVRIQTEAHVLRVDGSNGATLAQPRVIDVEVARGETKTIDASFFAEYTPGVESGLDRFLVKVSHMNEGGGKGNPEPALIMVKEGVFCPPEYQP